MNRFHPPSPSVENRHLQRYEHDMLVEAYPPHRERRADGYSLWVRICLTFLFIGVGCALLFLLIMLSIDAFTNPRGVTHLADVILQDMIVCAASGPFAFYALMACGLAFLGARVLKEYAGVFVFIGRGIAKFGVLVEHPTYAILKGAKKGLHVFYQVSQDRFNYTIKGDMSDTLQLDEPKREPDTILSFARLLQNGAIQQAAEAGQLLLGYIDGVLTRGSWLELYSCAVAGKSGMGKSTTVLFLIYQAVLNAARLIVIDPHEGNDESLATRLEPIQAAYLATNKFDAVSAQSVPEMLKRVRWLKSEMVHRQLCKITSPPIIFVVDEFNAVMRKDDQLAREIVDVLLDIAQEGRKFGMYALLIAQVWTMRSIRNPDVRYSLASAIVHRTGKSQAELLLDDPEYARAATRLAEGVAYFMDTHGTIHELHTPWTTVQDGQMVARLLKAGIPEATLKPDRKQGETRYLDDSDLGSVKPDGNQMETRSPNQIDDALEAKLARVLKLQAKNMAKPDIMRAIWDVSPGKGDKYERANEEYLTIMQMIAERLGIACD